VLQTNDSKLKHLFDYIIFIIRFSTPHSLQNSPIQPSNNDDFTSVL